MCTVFRVKSSVSALIIAAMLLLSLSDTVRAENVIREENKHAVVSGDNLVKISDRYGVSIGAIALANGLTSTKIFVGQQLVIPDYDAPVNPISIDRDLHVPITYVVRSGDTLGNIAQSYGSAVDKIVAASELLSTSILVDQFLTIPPELSLEVSNEIPESDADIVSEEIASDASTEDNDNDSDQSELSLDVSNEIPESDADIISDEINSDFSADYISSDVTIEIGVLQDEKRQRQELHNAGYEYAFSASAEDIERIYEYTVNGSRDTAVDAVINYWNYVSQGKYDLSWQLLSTGFRDRVHGSSFESYVQGYHDMDLCSISAENVENTSDRSLETVVNAVITYRTGPDCTPVQLDMRLTLRDRALVGVWDIDGVDVSLEAQGNKLNVASPDSERGWIDIDVSNQRAYAMKGEQQIREFVISTGTARYPTITGQFQIYIKHLKADMRGVDLGVPWYLPDVPYVMYFYSGYGIHGTYWHDNFGTPMSHGCINLTIEDAEWLYNFSEIGTSVKIHH
ncbi:MAG: hypothetical protein CL612_04765 [Anaerolineaceae bacterium]|nr:hypothetical protein [Anaerolineaceae bacterium]